MKYHARPVLTKDQEADMGIGIMFGFIMSLTVGVAAFNTSEIFIPDPDLCPRKKTKGGLFNE